MESDEEIGRVPEMGGGGGAVQASGGGSRRRGRSPADKENKRLKRLLRNRVSAQQARERKKAYLGDLEVKVKELESKNAELEERLSTFQIRKARGGGRGKGNGKAPSSSSQTGAEEEEGEEERGKRSIWTVWENAALAKSWVGVVEDPYVGANQYIDRLWHRISDAYLTHKPAGAKPRSPEQCRKQWDRLRPKLSRFAGLYQNNLRMATSGMSEEDVKNRALSQYPDKELKFKEFDQWEAFLVVRGSQKFCAGVDSGWKRTKINSSGEYSSSAGSHELPEAEEVSPLPRSDSRRRRRPMGQKAAQRMARGSGSGSGSFEVESEAPEAPDEYDRLARAQLTKTLSQNMHRWYSTHDPAYKRMCKDVIDACRRDLGMPPIDDYGVEIGGGDVGGGSGTGDGDEDEDEEE